MKDIKLIVEKYLKESIPNKIIVVDERYIGNNIILLMQDGDIINGSIKSITLKKYEMDTYNRNNQEDLKLLWKLANYKVTLYHHEKDCIKSNCQFIGRSSTEKCSNCIIGKKYGKIFSPMRGVRRRKF